MALSNVVALSDYRRPTLDALDPLKATEDSIRDAIVGWTSLYLTLTPHMTYPGRADVYRSLLETTFGKLPY